MKIFSDFTKAGLEHFAGVYDPIYLAILCWGSEGSEPREGGDLVNIQCKKNFIVF